MSHSGSKDPFPLGSPVTACRGVGPKTASVLERIGITTVEHLLYHFPRTYLDRRSISPIASVTSSHPAVVRGDITGIRSFRPSRRLHITQCVISDETGSMKAVWFNQPYLQRSLSAGTSVILSGGVSDRAGLQMENPDIEVLSGGEQNFLHTLGLVPVYPLTEGIGQKQLRRLLRSALDEFLEHIPENLPSALINAEKLVSRRRALFDSHFPGTDAEREAARERIAFEEFLALQLCIQSSRAVKAGVGTAHTGPPALVRALDSGIPFDLTSSQQRAIAEIFRRMESSSQMNVLLQGDVGSGKTIVAAYSMLKAIENDRQAVLMAPTEILAEQHISSLLELLRGMGLRSALLTGSRTSAEKRHALKLLASGEPALVVGTHALVEQKVSMPNLGLIIIDEQHRFGVNQRATLRGKGLDADLIIMTATPIPRTLALALYGDFETILIDEPPPGRRPVKTHHVHERDREHLYRAVREEIASGRQVFVVCPEIEERSEPADRPVANAKTVYRKYTGAFPELSIGVLHGRMSPDDREETLERFRQNEIQILVATTIIEVGVDIPNANAIVIEDADRFGLAQLHQLRGRVGRAHHASRCFLLAEPTTAEGARRIEIMTSTSDGFKIAEHDLLLRGPGEFLGTAQSGLPPLRVGHLIRDAAILERARLAAIAILRDDPSLGSHENEPLRFLLGKSRIQTVHL